VRSTWGLAGLLALVAASAGFGQEVLPGTARLQWPEAELPDRIMDQAHAFVEQQIGKAAAKRRRYWNYDFTSGEAYIASVAANRERLRTILGVVDERLPPRMERYGDENNPALVLQTDRYRVYQVRWPVLNLVDGEGLLLQPIGSPTGRVVVVPDADVSPEQVLGLAPGLSSQRQIARRLAEAGLEVVVLQVVSREKLETDDRRLIRADYTDREWIYRQAFHMGRHVIGYEVQRVLAVVDWFARRPDTKAKIGVAGYGEGGLIALFAAAIDRRIDAALVSGYFDRREEVWREPIYRNVWARLKRFGDAEVASLVLPRRLIIEHCRFPEVADHKGRITTPSVARVRGEVERIVRAEVLPAPQLVLSGGGQGEPYSPAAVSALLEALSAGPERAAAASPAQADQRSVPPAPARTGYYSAEARRQRARDQLERHVQWLVRRSEHVRDAFFLYKVMPEFTQRRWSTERRHPVHRPERFIEAAREYRRKFYEEAMGRFDEPLVPPNPRSRLVVETDRWKAYDVVLDVFDGLCAWGVLVLPKDLKPDERRPVVVCQHGRGGVPRDTIDAHKSAYNDFAARLAERGYVVFAPHNLYRGEDRYRWLDRKANTIGCSLFSLIIAQHDQIVRWLDSLPVVDGRRIAFYGLSYGGESAMRIPAALEKYCLSICSGDFNQWTRKVAATDQPFSFMFTIEWEMPYWNLGHTFDYAEMAYLIFPRPLMVERGHNDLVGRDRWVAHEYAKVRWLYAQFGLANQTEIEFFQGGHSINGEGTFKFLDEHLQMEHGRGK